MFALFALFALFTLLALLTFLTLLALLALLTLTLALTLTLTLTLTLALTLALTLTLTLALTLALTCLFAIGKTIAISIWVVGICSLLAFLAIAQTVAMVRPWGRICGIGLTGKKPVGWLGSGLTETWNTLGYLIDEGVEYIADWVNDDQPYLMDVGGRRIVSIPYSYEINDSPFLYHRYGTMDQFVAMMRRQFDVLYEEGRQSGRVMAICLHPFLVGVPHRIRQLDEALAYVCSHDRVWLATGEEIVRHYLASGATF